jgi:hypothetical protein
VVRSDPPENLPSENEAQTQTVRTLQNHQRDFPCGVSAETPHGLGNTVHDVFHTSLLLPYHETTTHSPNFSQPPPELVDGEEEYQVEHIMGHRKTGRGKKLQYLVKWMGYPDSDNTWEPATQIHAPDLIKQY